MALGAITQQGPMKSKNKIINKIISIISIGIFGFCLWHYIDYLIRYLDGENFCFGYPTWQVLINIGLCLFAIFLSIRLFNGKIQLIKSIILLIFTGLLMWIVVCGLLYI